MAMDTAGRITITQRAPLASQTRSWERSMRTSDVIPVPHDAKRISPIEGSVEMHQATFSPKRKKYRRGTRQPGRCSARPPEGIWEVSSAFFSNKMVHP